MTNTIVVLSDDQRKDTLPYMYRTLRKFPRVFEECHLNVPVCDAARAAVLTGQYAQGAANGVYKNGNDITARTVDALPLWLQTAGVETAVIGKYPATLGGTNLTDAEGWDYQRTLASNEQDAYGYTYHNGTSESSAVTTQYQMDWLSDEVETYLQAATPPFFLWVTPTNPHVDTTDFDCQPHVDDIDAWRKLEWTLDLLTDTTAKPSWISGASQLSATLQAQMVAKIRRQICELNSVDRFIDTLFARLDTETLTATTNVIYASEGGPMLGEQRMGIAGSGTLAAVSIKDCPYAPSVHAPLLATGPDFPGGKSYEPVTLADITATAVATHSATATVTLDGVDLRAVVSTPTSYDDREILYEHGAGASGDITIPAGEGIITGYGHTYPRFKLVRYPGETDPDDYELYDLDADPTEKTNLANDAGYAETLSALNTALDALVA